MGDEASSGGSDHADDDPPAPVPPPVPNYGLLATDGEWQAYFAECARYQLEADAYRDYLQARISTLKEAERVRITEAERIERMRRKVRHEALSGDVGLVRYTLGSMTGRFQMGISHLDAVDVEFLIAVFTRIAASPKALSAVAGAGGGRPRTSDKAFRMAMATARYMVKPERHPLKDAQCWVAQDFNISADRVEEAWKIWGDDAAWLAEREKKRI